MSKLDELIRELCPDGVEYKKLGEIATVLRGASPRPIKKYITNDSDGVNWIKIGDVPVGSKYITQSEEKITKEGAEKSRYVRKGDFILSNSMSFGRPYILAIDGCIHDGWLSISNFKDVFLSDYLYYLLSSSAIQQEMKKRASFGGAVQNLNADIVKALVLPVPPIEVQREIVRMLDSYTESVVELQRQLTAELTARKTQYAYYRDKLLKAETNAYKYKLGEIATVTKLAGFEFTNYVTYSENGNIIALRGLNVKNGRLDLHDVKYVDKSDFSKLERSKLHIGDMLFTYVGTVGQVAIVDEEDKYYLAPNVALIRCNKEVLLPQYMKYYFQTTRFWDKQIRRLLQSSSMQNIPMEKIRKFEIAVPPLDVQNRIVNVLDNFEKICSDLNIGLPAEIEARQKQYEYYRDKLLTFKEVAAT